MAPIRNNTINTKTIDLFECEQAPCVMQKIQLPHVQKVNNPSFLSHKMFHGIPLSSIFK